MPTRISKFPKRLVLGTIGRVLGKRYRNAMEAAWYAAETGHPIADWVVAFRAAMHWSGGDAPQAERLWRRLADARPQVAWWPLELAKAARVRGDHPEQERLLLEAKARGVRDPLIDAWLVQSGREEGRVDDLDSEALGLVGASSAPPASRFWASIHLSTAGHIQDARRGLQGLTSDPRLGWEARIQLTALDLIEREGTTALIPGWFSPKRSSALIRTGSDTLLVVFLQPGGTFGVAGNAILALLSSSPPNILYLYDSNALFHLAGTDRFGPGYPAMLDGLRRCAADIGASRIVTFARCAPGYTAIRVGVDLGAERVIAISPVTTITPEDMGDDGRAPVLQRRLAKAIPEHNRDLLPEIAAQAKTEFHIFYNRAHTGDRHYAERIAAAPRVTLYPVDEPARRDPIEQILRDAERERLRSCLDFGSLPGNAPAISRSASRIGNAGRGST